MLLRIDDYEKYGLDPHDSSLAVDLEAVEHSIRKATNNRFHVRSCRVEAASSGGVLLGVCAGICPGDTVHVTGSGANDGLYVVKCSGRKNLTLDRALADAPFNRCTLVRYPPDVVRGAVRMVEYDRKMRPKDGIASESLSRHSVSYEHADGASLIAGYPPEVSSFLKPYMRARF